MLGPQARVVTIVEDDPSMSRALERILRIGGFRTATYASAEALLARDDALEGSCLVVDVQLPGIDGFALHRRLAARGNVPPVVFISAFDERAAAADAAALDACTFLAKPFRGRTLLETIDRLLSTGGGERVIHG